MHCDLGSGFRVKGFGFNSGSCFAGWAGFGILMRAHIHVHVYLQALEKGRGVQAW